MPDKFSANEKQLHYEEIKAKAANGMAMLLANILLMIASIIGFIRSIGVVEEGKYGVFGIAVLVACITYFSFIGPVLFTGLKVLRPKEALVLTLFGRYYGTLKGEGFFFVNPFAMAVNPATQQISTGTIVTRQDASPGKNTAAQAFASKAKSRIISLKVMTLNNAKQKINDQLGNPVIIGIVVIWRVANTAKAVFNVDSYTEYLSIQCDSALRDIVRLYPYDVSGDNDNEKSLRGSSTEIAERLTKEIQERVDIAGLEILEARITHLSYAPEIAAAMLQRQQASAIVDARQMIVEGAVGMVEMALSKLNENDIVHLDEERKASMVSNLLVVLCGNRDAQPVVNTGSLY